jgi:hypothetical protein
MRGHRSAPAIIATVASDVLGKVTGNLSVPAEQILRPSRRIMRRRPNGRQFWM